MTVCHSHCGGACPLKVHVEGGRITRIETDPELRACLRGRAYRQRCYAPDRLRFPLKRTGNRGEGKFTRISWDEALDTVANQIKRVKEESGPEAILFLASIGDVTWLHNPGLIERLLTMTGGYSGPWGAASGEGAVFAAMASYGTFSAGNSREDFQNSRLIILWGWNPIVTCGFGRTPHFLMKAKELGCRFVAVDPRYTDSAALLADKWVPIRPGTDTAMLIAMAYVTIKEDLIDDAFIDKYTVGFERYRDYVLGKDDGEAKTPAWAETITGVPATTIADLARDFATMKPAALMDGFAPGRTAYGEQFHRAAIALAAMTGNIGLPGTNAPGTACLGDIFPPVNLGPHPWAIISQMSNPVDDKNPPRKESPFYIGIPVNYYNGGPSRSRVNRFLLADAILKGRRGGYPADYKLIYMVNINYVNQYANSNKIAEALKSLEFVVIQDQFLTPTARYADIILPTNSMLERNDLTTGGVGSFYGYMNKAIDPLDEARSHYDIALELGKRLGVMLSDKTEEEWLRYIVSNCKDIPEYEDFRTRGVLKVTLPRPYICFAEQIRNPEASRFFTPSGKIEIFSQRVADIGNPLLPPIPKYIETWESRNDPIAAKYPLQAITTHTRRRAHTQFDNLPWLRELYPQSVWINTLDAEARGIKDGDMVRVFNDRGEMLVPAKVTERILPGVVDIPQGAWYSPDEHGVDHGGCANVLTSDRPSPAGAFPANTLLVQVEKVIK
ncbi:MAG: molybdopterin-dependent oxidoreductase [Dehalococcoidia bacterium]|nr:molybdopterin-dependent oxidoreductase [Dehalococcoidia bacterium]